MTNKRTLIIRYCDHCPHFSYSAVEDFSVCEQTDYRRVIPCGMIGDIFRHPIPDWCPLESVTEVER